MKFFTNRIPTSSSGDFAKLVEKVAASNKQVKTAAAADIISVFVFVLQAATFIVILNTVHVDRARHAWDSYYYNYINIII